MAGAASRERTRCARRLAWLAARRDPDGSFNSAEAIAALRRDHRTLPPTETHERLAALASDPAAARQIQLEAGAWLVRDALERDDYDAALSLSAPLWAAAQAGEGSALTQRELADLHSQALQGSGDSAGARAVEDAAALPRSARPREGAALLRQAARREGMRRASLGILAAFGLLCGPAALRGWAAGGLRPRGLVPLATSVTLAAGLAALHSPEDAPVFGILLLGAAGVHLVALGALVRARAGYQRAAVSGLTAAATLAIGYLAAHRAGMLDSVGL